MARCEGWVRTGGVFTLGPVEWDQCKKDGVFSVTFQYPGEAVKTLPACRDCLGEVEKSGATILKSVIIDTPSSSEVKP